MCMRNAQSCVRIGTGNSIMASGGLEGTLVSLRHQSRDGTRTIKAMMMHSGVRPRRHTHANKRMASCACIHLLVWPLDLLADLAAAIAVRCRHVTKPQMHPQHGVLTSHKINTRQERNKVSITFIGISCTIGEGPIVSSGNIPHDVGRLL